MPAYDGRLAMAEPLVPAQPVYVSFKKEFEDGLFSYRPWWSAFEERTVIFLADNIQKNVYFYAAVDKYPIYLQTDLEDKKNMLAVNSSSP